MKYIILFLLFTSNIFALETLDESITVDSGEYNIRLINGDQITVEIKEILSDRIVVETFFNEKTVIYLDEIVEITPIKEFYRHANRVFIMPTAVPIENNHFIGLYELAFLYGGVGIMDIISITAGRSFVPFIAANQQLTVANVKLTFMNKRWDDMEGGMYLAAGGQVSFLNANNQINNFYVVSTFELTSSKLSGGFIYKLGGDEITTIQISDSFYDVPYPANSLGIMLGLEKRLSKRRDLYFIGELWNSDISRPSNTGILAGLRICNSTLSFEAGISLFTAGQIAPFTSVNWTPF